MNPRNITISHIIMGKMYCARSFISIELQNCLSELLEVIQILFTKIIYVHYDDNVIINMFTIM